MEMIDRAGHLLGLEHLARSAELIEEFLED